MFERHEKWFVLAIIAIAIWYFYKKGSMPGVSVAGSEANPYGQLGLAGSLVNQAVEPGTVQPAQATSPVRFTPAQPSTVPISQRVSVGTFTYAPSVPVLRYGSVAPVGVRQVYSM